jgi:uncharacterized repeat protein (TIGR02543 family)
MDNTRVAGLTRSYEEFFSSPSGGSTYTQYVYPERMDYVYPDMTGSDFGFATISVNGLSFTYNIYKVGTTDPVWSQTFSKLNTPPTISDISDQTTDEDTATGAIPFTVGDAEASVDFLTVTASSSNTTLVPDGNISLGGSGANRTINIMPAPNLSGNATITVSVNDGNVNTDDTFLLTVNAVNDAPVADPQSVSMLWNTSIDITLTGSDVENDPLTFGIQDNPAHGSLSGSGADRTYTPTPNYSGPDSFTFTVNDGTVDSAPATVSIDVTAHTISGNAGIAGATLSYIEGTPQTATADGAGAYSFQVPTDWSGTVTPSKPGYTFSPESMTYSNVLADLPGQDYTATGVILTISGNAGIAGATLSYTDGTPKTATADDNGLYSFQVPYGWSGTVTPSFSGYGFRPATRTYANITEDQVAQDYTTDTSRTYYVDNTNPACTDTGSVASFEIPFCTIGRGAYFATAGQIVHVVHGTYAESVYPSYSGAAGNPITFWGDPGVTVTGQPGTPTTNYSAFALSGKSYIVIDGFNITNTSNQGIYVDASDHITITNNHVTNAGVTSLFHPYTQGIYLRGTTYSTISGNITDHNTCIGIRLINNSNHNLVSNNVSFENFSVVETDAAGIETTGSSYNTIINNITYSNEDSGINIYVYSATGLASTHNLVIGNLSYENGDHGIDVNNSPYNTLVGNTVQGNGTVGINVEGETATGSHDTTIANNISVGNGFTPPSGSFAGNLRVDPASISGTSIDYDLFYRLSAPVEIIWNNASYTTLGAFQAAVSGQEVHGLEADPLFVDPVPSALRQTNVPYVGSGLVGDYYINAGSPAIDSANSNAPNEPLTDIQGNGRMDDPATPDTGAGVRTYDDRGAYEYLTSGTSLPTVTTQAVTDITATTATGNGTIAAPGVPSPSQHGVVWSTSIDPTTADNKTTDGAVGGAGAFTSAMTGLTPGTLYHVRAYATNTEGTVYGDDVSFTTLLLPTLTTQAATNISSTTATGNGTVTGLGVPNPTQHGFVWSTAANPTTADSKTTQGPVAATGAFTGSLTGLTPGTLYHIRAYATNAVGTAYGDDVTFSSFIEPTVTTQAATNITTTTATGNGNVTSLGIPNPTQHGVVWSTSANPTIANSKTTDGPVSATGAFTSSITGLTPGTLYHVRAYATNTAATSYGDDFSFTTLLAPTVTTQAATDITMTSATGNGNITVLGTANPTEHGVVWSTLPNPTTADSKTTDGPVAATGAFTSSITGLTPGTLYHVRAYATNIAGTSYGSDVTFTTLIAPTVTTQAATNITTTTATGNGNITVLGVPNPTQHGVVWSTSINPTLADSKTMDGPVSATGAFTSSMTGLAIGMQYHVRAYATNAVATVYGDDVVFTTLPLTTSTTTAATNAGAGANMTGTGTVDWLNPSFVTADDTSYATVTLTSATSHYLAATNYGFAIPANATINGIAVTIGRFESAVGSGTDVSDSSVRLLKAGVVAGSEKAKTGVEWPTGSPVAAVYGTTADLWGTTWTPADINASNFGVALSAVSGTTRMASVDYMQISVTYTVTTVSSSTIVSCGAGTPVVTYGSAITCVATVIRSSGSFTPTGNVSWTTSGSGSFATSPCVLSGSNGTATCSVSYTPSSLGSGSHLITATYAGDPSFFTSNGNQTVTVNKKAASVTPNAASKTYGDDDPASFSGTLAGFLPADGVTAAYSRAAGETVAGSPYTISAVLSPVGMLANYDITYNTADFTITKKAASVTPNAASKVLGEDDPILTGSLVGFVATDNVTANYSRVAGETIEGSPYAISATLSPAGVLGNYNITYNTADFTITAPQGDFTLAIDNVGNGAVTKDPNQTTYHYGDVVQLTAVPDAGWRFDHWSGGVTGTDNPVSITMNGDETVTAYYIQNAYTITITAEHGTITKDPDQATYLYNDVVVLTPEADAGWTFSGWSGDCSGSGACSVTMDADKSVTATFTQNILTTGIYDDTNAAWAYTGDWQTYSGAGPYDNTLHFTGTRGDSAEVSFVGEQFQLTYTALVDRGNVDVYVDGVKVATITESGPGSWQQTWTSDPLVSGTHTVRLENASDGAIIDIDAIKVIGTANILTAGTYDEASGGVIFTTNWYTYAGAGPYTDSLHFSITRQETAQFSFTGEQFGLIYTQLSDRGKADVYVDGVKVVTLDESGPGAWQQTWTSDPLASGTHTVRMVDAGGGTVDLDGIKVMSSATIVGAGNYDDTDPGLIYSTDWYTYAGPGPDGDTLHFSITPGESVLVSFTGQQFKLTYTQMSDRGLVDVYVDGEKVGTIDESGPGAWQQTWTSDLLPAGNHSLRLVQASAGIMDIDALQIIATPTILSAGVHDDMDPAWYYSTYWFTYGGDGPYADTLHFSINVQDTALVAFSGTQFVLTYTEMGDRGDMDVYVDGSKAATINENGSGAWQKTWTSGVYAAGPHSVRLVHASGATVDVDAITVLP